MMSGNTKGTFKSLRVSPGQHGRATPAWRKWPSSSHTDLRSGLTMGEVPVAIADCPAGVCLGLSFYQGICLVPQHSEPSEDGETGPSVFSILSPSVV